MSNIKSVINKPNSTSLLEAATSLGKTLLPISKENRTATIYDGFKGAQQNPIHIPKDIGVLIQRVRKSKNLSQQEMADLAGVGRRFLSELENGKPSLEFGKVISVANAIGIDLFAKQR